MALTARAALELASHEALVRQTYKDSVGVLTWCVGMTNATGHRVERYIGNPAPLQHCMNLFVWALLNYAKHVDEVFAGHRLTEAQYAAILSFTWNLGAGALRDASWVRHFKAGDMDAAEAAFKTWNKAGGKTVKGLVARRALEADLLFRGKWSNDGTIIEYTRLRSNMQVDFASAKRVNVTTELRNAFAGERKPIVDEPPQPDAPVQTPTLSPKPNAASLFAVLVAAILGFIGWRFAQS